VKDLKVIISLKKNSLKDLKYSNSLITIGKYYYNYK